MKQFVALLFATQVVFAAGRFRAGTARVDITPELPVWLSGYAIRSHPANQVLQHLWAKALAIDDGRGGRIVIVSMDLLGIPPEMSDEVGLRCLRQFGLKRREVWLNCSHTHSGPVVWPNLRIIFDFNSEDQRRAEAYATRLTNSLVAIVGEALQKQVPADLLFGSGNADFAINRRLAQLQVINPGREFPAPVDRSVPVIEVKGHSGNIIAILFGYACHNTTLTGEFYEVAGDYAGYAQAALEKSHPAAQAMFVMLCGGDQNPFPRSQLTYAERHGSELAAAVESVLAGPLTSLPPHIRTAFTHAELPLAEHHRQDFETELRIGDMYHRRRAQLILNDYDHVARSVHLPVQAIRFGSQLAVLTLGGEVVVDYAARAKQEYSDMPFIVAGYSNGVVSYIPSERVLREGGYEAADSIVYYGLPAPYSPGVEDRVFQSIHKVLKDVAVQPRRLARREYK